MYGARWLLQFEWNVDGIDEAEEVELVDLAIADDATPRGAAGSAGYGTDFDKELAEFANAFD